MGNSGGGYSWEIRVGGGSTPGKLAITELTQKQTVPRTLI